jgi:D-glucosaminate-6-phosphate ammonia-lyase
MKSDKTRRGTWSRRDVVRVGSMATAAGMMGGIAVTDAAPVSQAGASHVPASAKGPQVHTRIGVRPFINLTGTLTINGGALELPEVRDACHQAADYAVDLDELMEKVGARIAELLGCEAAIVTSCAAAALSHAPAFSSGARTSCGRRS